MKTIRRLSAGLLSLILLLPLAACGTPETPEMPEAMQPGMEEPEAAAETEALDSIEARRLVSDNLPEPDFGGRAFRVLTYDFCTADFVSEGVTGALINDAVYNRNAAVSDRFDIVIETDGERETGQVQSLIQNSVKAGDDAFDLISQHMINTANLALSHHYRDWNDFEHIDPDREWWNRSAYEDLSIAGKSFLMAGGITLKGLEWTKIF